MKLKTAFLLITTAVGGVAVSMNAQAYGDPTNFTPPPAYVQYGDAQSYALQVFCDVNNLQASQCPWNIQSSDGHIMDLVNPANDTGNNGVITNPINMDNAYSTPSGTPQKPANPFFRPVDSGTVNGVSANTNGTNGTVANEVTLADGGGTWDASVASLNTFLSGTPGSQGLVFFFNNNQTGSGGNTFTSDENLAAWAKVWITDANNNIVTDASGNGIFYLTNMGGSYNPIYPTNPFGGGIPNGNVASYTGAQNIQTAPTGNTNAATDYILSGGPICTSGGVVVDCSGPGPFDTRTDNNLGANQAAYAVIFPELNAILAGLSGNLTSYTLHLDVRLGCDPTLFTGTGGASDCTGKSLDNGGEKIFIGALSPGGPPVNIPEPATLLLVGLGVLAIGFASRKARTLN